MNKILFFYPSKGIGGAQLLFYRCAKYFIENTKEDVYYVDYLDGYVAGMLKGSRCTLLEYREGGKIKLPDDTLSILHLGMLLQLETVFEFSLNNRFLFWSIHPNQFAGIKAPWGGYMATRRKRAKIGKHIGELCQCGVIRFMDFITYYVVSKDYLLNKNVDYLPIFIEEDKVKRDVVFKRSSQRPLAFMWLSRLDDDKVYACINVMNELEQLCKDYQVELYIVGSGTRENDLKEITKNYHYKVNCMGRMEGDELNRFVDEKIDVGVGNGTSMLEIVKRGKPVVIRGIINKKYVDTQYKDYLFLHEEYGFALGILGNKEHDEMARMMNPNLQETFREKVERLLANYEEIAKADYDYLCKYHIRTAVCKQIEDAIVTIREDNLEEHLQLINKLANEYRSVFYRKYVAEPLKKLKKSCKLSQ